MSTTITERNKQLIRRESTEIIEKKNVDVIDELYADEVTIRVNRAGGAAPVVGRDDLKSLYREWNEAFPDLTVDVTVEAAEGDVVIQHLTLAGTHEGAFRGIEPTGNGIEVDGFHFRRIRDGKIVETGSMVGMVTLFEQLGVELPINA